MTEATVRHHLDQHNGRAPGFDAVRFFLATLIMGWHAFSICYKGMLPVYLVVAGYSFAKPLLRFLIPAFFFLSGFLVAGSALRLRSTKTFLTFRGLRIFPALLVEVFLSAILLGAAITTLPIQDYYSHPEFYSYFANIVGFVHFNLPGVFEHNNLTAVNINLWTLPSEFYCYLILAGLMVSGIAFDRKKYAAVFLAGTLGLVVFFIFIRQWGAYVTHTVHQSLFIYAFFIGVACFLFADKIPLRKTWFAASLAGLWFFCWDQTTILGLLSTCYVTLYLGFANLKSLPVISRGDYSYGIYLYGFPIEQALWHYLPFVRGNWIMLFLIAFPTTLLFAALSWHLLEKPFLSLKNKIKPTAAGQ